MMVRGELDLTDYLCRALYKGMTIGHSSSKRRTFKTMALALGIFELVAKL